MSLQFVQIQLTLGGDELVERVLCNVRLLDRAVKFGSITGRNDRSLADPAAGRRAQTLAQSPDRCTHLVRQKGNALAHSEGGGGVIEPEGKELHRRLRWPLSRAWILFGTAEL